MPKPIPKTTPWRSKKYRDWVKTLPCAHCGIEFNVEFHHLRGVSLIGIGTKAPDYWGMPLCGARIQDQGCHPKLHQGKIDLQLQWKYICETIDRAFKEGKLTFSDKPDAAFLKEHGY